MGWISNDYCCPECQWMVKDHLSDRAEIVQIPCEICETMMTKVPAFAKLPSEWPQFVQDEIIAALDPETDAALVNRARNKDVRRDEWDGILKARGMKRSEASDLEESAKRRKVVKAAGGDPVEQARLKTKLIEKFREKKAVSVSSGTGPKAATVAA